MKFTVKKEVEEEWEVVKWGPIGVMINGDWFAVQVGKVGFTRQLYAHEKDLPKTPALPQAVYDAAREEIRKHRATDGEFLICSGQRHGRATLEYLATSNNKPWRDYWQRCLEYYDRHAPKKLADNEVEAFGNVWQLRWHDGQEQYKLNYRSHWYSGCTRGPLFDASRAWFAANRPLAENEVEWCGCVWELRWHEGKKQCKTRRGRWETVVSSDLLEASEAWFEKNRPLAPNETKNWNKTKRGKMSIEGERLRIDWEDGQVSKEEPHRFRDKPERLAFWEANRPKEAENFLRVVSQQVPDNEFVDSEGRRWTFAMQDDGEAGINCNDTRFYRCPGSTLFCNGASDWSRAALAYRDKERARWTFRFLFPEDKNSPVWARCDGLSFTVDQDGQAAFSDGDVCDVKTIPTWVREKARKMWEERQEKPVRETFTAYTNRWGDVAISSQYRDAKVRITIEPID